MSSPTAVTSTVRRSSGGHHGHVAQTDDFEGIIRNRLTPLRRLRTCPLLHCPSAKSSAIYKRSSIGSRLYRDQTAYGRPGRQTRDGFVG
jgi:hypothetical protein